MSDRWVNARITLVFPLEDIDPDASVEDKMGALEIAHDDVLAHFPEEWFVSGFVSSGKWEDAS